MRCFYCRKINLVIEIDGESHHHEDAIKYDKRRQNKLEAQKLEEERKLAEQQSIALQETSTNSSASTLREAIYHSKNGLEYNPIVDKRIDFFIDDLTANPQIALSQSGVEKLASSFQSFRLKQLKKEPLKNTQEKN